MPYKDPEKKKVYQEQYRLKNPEKIKEIGRNYREKNREKIKNSQLECSYKITLNAYNLMFDKQQGCCAICGKHQSKLKRTLDTDHNHTTNKVRGLLCSNCNFVLGHSNDSVDVLQKAINYLKGENLCRAH